MGSAVVDRRSGACERNGLRADVSVHPANTMWRSRPACCSLGRISCYLCSIPTGIRTPRANQYEALRRFLDRGLITLTCMTSETTTWLTVDGLRIRCLQDGSAGSPVVFLHGGAVDGRWFQLPRRHSSPDPATPRLGARLAWFRRKRRFPVAHLDVLEGGHRVDGRREHPGIHNAG